MAAPTIRYYIRERLIPSGELTSPNQAVYGEGHVAALRLARALIEVGGLDVAQAREVIEHLAGKEGDRCLSLGAVQYALTPAPPSPGEEARARVEALLAARGWQVRPDNPAAREMRRVTDPAVPGAALAVVGLDVLGDRVLSAVRRLAQEDRLTRG